MSSSTEDAEGGGGVGGGLRLERSKRGLALSRYLLVISAVFGEGRGHEINSGRPRHRIMIQE